MQGQSQAAMLQELRTLPQPLAGRAVTALMVQLARLASQSLRPTLNELLPSQPH